MNKFQLFRQLRHHVNLSEKRSEAYTQNRASKIMFYIFGGIMVIYLIFIAVMLSLIANDETTLTPYELLYSLMPFLLFVDFLVRFPLQQTPAQLVKPYILLPIPKHSCVECFIVSAALTPNNLVWMALFVPYAIMSVVFSEGIIATLGFLFGLWLLVAINSLWYMLVRTLVNHRIWWWGLPTCVYLIAFSPLFLGDFSKFQAFYANMGEGTTHWNPFAFLLLFAMLAVVFMVNRSVQFHFVYDEMAADNQTKLRTISQFRYLERYGEVGEYMKLEIKSIMRNKNMRRQFISSLSFVILFSLMLSFTEIYDDSWNSNFLTFYNFAIFGTMGLLRVMSAEGNYIDGIMVHKENIISLLKAKYYLYALMLVLPFLLMIPTIIQGKCTLLMLLAAMAFTAGPVFFMLMQTAVYNRQTMPLNTKLTRKGSIETNYFTGIMGMVALFLPVIIIKTLITLLSPDTAYLTLFLIGLSFIITNGLWIRNIYGRMMKRRYTNMESFRASR